ncbi:hypothetical protein G9A89_016259 [Geosiphon pyriformis]|nr:hypothetical protein G9A89_016259 [Geosiphon pyriformis]
MAIVNSSIAVLNKSIIESGPNVDVKSVESKKKRRNSALEDSVDNRKIAATRVLNNCSWGFKTSDTTESDNVDMEEEFLVEKTSFDYEESSAFAGENSEQMSKSSKILIKRALRKLLEKINFLDNNGDNILLNTSLMLLPFLKALVNIPV